MSEPLEIDIITIFPGMLRGFLEESMLGRAAASGLAAIRLHLTLHTPALQRAW